MRCRILCMVFLALLAVPVWSISFVEIHFDPAGEDRGHEFIELRMDRPINMTGFILADAASNDTLFPIRITDGTLAVIVDDSFNTSLISDDASVYSAGVRIGNGLGNTGDEVILFDQSGAIIANASYDSSIGGEGIPIVLVNGFWAQGTPGGTPGWDDQAAGDTIMMNATNETDASEDVTNRTDDERDAAVDETCPTTFSITTEQGIVSSGDRISFGFNFSKNIDEFRITYGIEDPFGDVRKSYLTTTNRAMKTYTPKTDMPVDALLIKASLDARCLNSRKQAQMAVIVTNNDAKDAPDDDDDAPRREERKTEQREEGRNLVFDLVNATLVANQSVPFITALSIFTDDEPHVFTIWSYAYKGSVSYSGDRESNRQVITMDAGEHRFITLANTIDAPGTSANYKVRIQKDNLKTPYEITTDLLILPKDARDTEDAGEEDKKAKGAKAPEGSGTQRAAREDILDLLPDNRQRMPVPDSSSISRQRNVQRFTFERTSFFTFLNFGLKGFQHRLDFDLKLICDTAKLPALISRQVS